jgi:hypothetical protein
MQFQARELYAEHRSLVHASPQAGFRVLIRPFSALWRCFRFAGRRSNGLWRMAITVEAAGWVSSHPPFCRLTRSTSSTTFGTLGKKQPRGKSSPTLIGQNSRRKARLSQSCSQAEQWLRSPPPDNSAMPIKRICRNEAAQSASANYLAHWSSGCPRANSEPG